MPSVSDNAAWLRSLADGAGVWNEDRAERLREVAADLERLESERDAAQAEVARLREAGLKALRLAREVCARNQDYPGTLALDDVSHALGEGQ